MRVLQVTPGFYPAIGGVERHVEAISRCLVAQGHLVVVATMGLRGRRLPDDVRWGAEIRRFDSLDCGEAYRIPRGLMRYLIRTRNAFDVVHVHSYHASLIPMVAAARPRCMVVTPHLNDQPHSLVARILHYPYAVVGRWSMQQAHAVVCVSRAERERVAERLGVQRDRIAVIPNGVDDRLLAADAGGSTRDGHLLLYVGRLQPYKRVEAVISALAALPPGFHLVIVGDGPHRAFLEAHARQCGVAERVRFMGQAVEEDLMGWYRRAQVALNLSAAEAFGMTVLEAVAAGCQVVCSDIPAFCDLAHQFPERITTVQADDDQACAAAIVAAAERTGGRPADLSGFTWDAVTRRLVEVYESAGKVTTAHS